MRKLSLLSAALSAAALVFMGLMAVRSFQGLSVAYAQAVSAASSTAQSTSSLQAEIDTNNQAIANLNQEIATYQQQLQQVGANKKTLQAAINALNIQKKKIQAQVSATQRQINVTQLQIQELGASIENTQQSIVEQQDALGAQLRILQKAENKPLLMQLLGTGTLADAWDEVNATLQMQEAIQNKMTALQHQENSLADSQNATKQQQVTLTSQQQSLAAQQQSLAATAQQKSDLLAQTNAQQAQYEKLLAAAEAQLASFSAFTQNAGGSKLLGNQTQCDSWGCYYSQRDTAWGKLALNGTKYTLASDGCLVTAMAMVLTHYGYKDVTPVSINSNPYNFASYYPAYLLNTINVNGVTATRQSAAIDATLAAGNPVVIGLHAYGGTHFVVLVSGSRGNYLMKDPYIAGGNNISFTDHYTMRSIFSITKVIIS